MRTLAVDTETALIAPGRRAPPLACVTWADDSGAGIDDPEPGLRRIRDALRCSDTLLVGANVAFDLGVVAQADPSLLPLIFAALDADRIADVQVVSQLRYVAGINKQPRHSLATLAERWLDQGMGGKDGGADSWRLHYRRLIGVPVADWPEAARSYAITDAIVTRDVWHAQQADKVRVPDLFPQVRAAWGLHVMGSWGFQVDPDAVEELDRKLRPPVEQARKELARVGIFRGDGSRDQKLLRAMVSAAYDGNPPRTPKGAVSTSEETLSGTTHPDLLRLASIAKDEKELAAFLPMLLDASRSGLPVCPRWRLLKRTGRTACSAPNAQQLPKRAGVRECIVPRRGNLFFGADYAIAELRSLAQVLITQGGPCEMARALNAGQDLHVLMGGHLLGLDNYTTALARFSAGDAKMKSARQLAKALNFGFPGGLGATTFVKYAAGYGVAITEDRAKQLKQLWLQTFPEMRGYFERVARACSAGPATITQPYSGRLRGAVGYTDGCNTLFQGLTSDGCKRALYEITREQLVDRSSPLYGTRLNAFVHDEFLAEGPAAQAPEAGDRLAELMIREMAEVAPDVVHEAEPYLMKQWSKGAATKRDAAGRLTL